MIRYDAFHGTSWIFVGSLRADLAAVIYETTNGTNMWISSSHACLHNILESWGQHGLCIKMY